LADNQFNAQFDESKLRPFWKEHTGISQYQPAWQHNAHCQKLSSHVKQLFFDTKLNGH